MSTQPHHPGDVLRVAGAQVLNVVGDLAGNARRIEAAIAWAEEQDADVVVFPELALTGYPVADLVGREEFVDEARATLDRIARTTRRTAAVVSTIGDVPPRRSWDTRERSRAISAAVLCDGERRGMYHKVLLPNYEAFDEARSFAPGSDASKLWRFGPVVAGIAICEDAWSGDGPPEAQAAAGAQVLLIPNASPFHMEKPSGRLDLCAAVARRNGVPVVYINSVGGQDDLVFDGGSLVVDSGGDLLHRARQFAPETFCVDVPIGPPRLLTRDPTTVHARPPRSRAPLPPTTPAEVRSSDEQAWDAVVLGTRDFIRRNGASSVVLGLSGGIDAAVTAAVAADALGPDNVLGVAMPAPASDPEELEDARELARALGIGLEVIEIAPITQAIEARLGPALAERERFDNVEALEARTRAGLLWTLYDQLGHLPLATSNKSELSIGSAARYGDLAGAWAPLKDCSKSLVYRLAALPTRGGRAIPQRILERPATVRADEATSLPSYGVLDPIVERYLEQGKTVSDLVADGFDAAVVRGVLQLVDDAELKRRASPPGPKVSARAFGQDLRMPITNAWRPFHEDEQELVPDAAQPEAWPPTQPETAGAA